MKPNPFLKIMLLVTLILTSILIISSVIKLYRVCSLEYSIRQNMNSGNFADNIPLYNKIIELEPSAENYLYRANGYIYLLDYEMAIKDISKALNLKPKINDEAKALLLTIKSRVSGDEYDRLLSLLESNL